MVRQQKQQGNSQLQYILFDLDDTLYPKEAGVMKVIVERILCFMHQQEAPGHKTGLSIHLH